MLFNSFTFILIFLPLTLLLYYLIVKHTGREPALIWLVLASLLFYGWWNPAYVSLITGSILFNYMTGSILARHRSRWVFWSGISGNLLLLVYYKYTNFIVANIASVTGAHLAFHDIVLPLAISFFTFQQIAYLADVYSGKTREFSFHHYALFVLFFPQLIAGPIVHHAEMLPQFTRGRLAFRHSNISAGLTIFIIGLFKKVMIADNLAGYSGTVFNSADMGHSLTFLESWTGALAYTFQLYFDFSGYSDMAIGIARMFGIHLPINFNAPYRASSIIDFWRRWHITLSRFLRDYLYIPLGGNRLGTVRRYINLTITMLLGGLWHGASWTFFVWGALHAFYLMTNHGFRYLCSTLHLDDTFSSGITRKLFTLFTFIAVVVGWVFFRSETFQGAYVILKGMSGLNGFAPNHVDFEALAWILACIFITWWLPTTQSFMKSSRHAPGCDPAHAISWRASSLWSTLATLMAAIVILNLHSFSEFLYFRF